MLRVLQALYRRLGPSYPRFLIWAQFQLAHVVVLGGVGLLRLYQDMTAGQFWRLVLVAQALILLENVWATALASRMLRPVDVWLRGQRSPATASAAWRALAELPTEWTRRYRWQPVALNVVPFCAYAGYELGAPWWGFGVLFAGGLVVLVYGEVLRFFAMEIALRPVLEHVAASLPEDFAPGRGGLSLRSRLLIGLPLINVISGVIVAGLSTDGQADLAELGVDVLLAVGVAVTITLELSLLLARSVLLPVGELRRATERVRQGDFSVRVPVVSTDETGGLARSFNEMVVGLEERERLRGALAAFVAPEVAERVVREGPFLEGEEVVVSVLFIDIRDFTSRAERCSARDLVALLNDFYDRVVPVLTRHGGNANKFIGDGLLAVFGAPTRLDDHADRAVNAALELAALVRREWAGDLRVGIGVNSGPVVAGTVGGGGRVDFTVIGDTVNTAARVEEATRASGDDVLVTESTLALVRREHGDWEPRDAIALKGKTAPVRLFAPVRVAASSGGDRRPGEVASAAAIAERADGA